MSGHRPDMVSQKGRPRDSGRPVEHAPARRPKRANPLWSALATHVPPAVQAKLEVGAPDDEYERQADRVADQVLRTPEPPIQRPPEEEEPEELRRKPLAEPIASTLRREAELEEEEEKLQAQAESNEILSVAPGIENQVSGLQGGGAPLSEEARAYFEPRLGQDLGDVRIHTDATAAQAARALNAKAFTVGNDVVFGTGRYASDPRAGERLLAHELAHVVQQRGSGRGRPRVIQRETLIINSQRPHPPSTTVGHAFLTLVDADGRRITRGFWAACTRCDSMQNCSVPELLGTLATSVRGRVCNDAGQSADDSISFDIDASQYQRIARYIRNCEQRPPRYWLPNFACVDFVVEAARSGGVIIPRAYFEGISEPIELSRYIEDELDRREVERLFDLGLTLVRVDGSGPVSLGTETHFEVRPRPRRTSALSYRWVIADRADNRYLLWGPDGDVFRYTHQYGAYIPARTRELLRRRGVVQAEVLCRVCSAGMLEQFGPFLIRSGSREALLRLPITFSASTR